MSYKTGTVQFFLGIIITTVIISFWSCGRPVDVIRENNFDSLEFAGFVEEEFPFITTSIDARHIGPHFPEENYAPRTLALQLGDSASLSFDTDLLRWAVAWTGDFISMTGMAQISYDDPFNKENRIPEILGEPQIATGVYAGWSVGHKNVGDPRARGKDKEEYTWGPLPKSKGRWKGVYVHEGQAILNYSVGNTEIIEFPESVRHDGENIFIRTLRIGPTTDSLFLNLAELREVQEAEVLDRTGYFYQGEDRESVTAISVKDDRGLSSVSFEESRYVIAAFPPSDQTVDYTVCLWKGHPSKQASYRSYTSQSLKVRAIPAFEKGGSSLWKETVYTQGKLSPDTAAYVLDELVLPLPNPWSRNVRAADIAFFEDGRAAVVTFSGDVWILENINEKLTRLKWSRFASGLYEPLSIEIVGDEVYVFGKEGIVRLKDLNHDGMVDFYENFSNVMEQSMESREWAGDMVANPSGGFFIAKGSALDLGPKFTPKVMTGFREGDRHSGSILEISENGEQISYYATGLRVPFIGVHPKTGQVSASDQQGNFVPSTPVYLVDRGDYFGIPTSAHGQGASKISEPLVWIPHNVDRSGISQVWVNSDKMGSLNENLIHVSYGRPGLFRVLADSTSSPMHGGVEFIEQDYPAPLLQATVNPLDGQIYVAGFNIWGSNSTGISALNRLRYTGKDSYMINSFRAGREGVILKFDTALDSVENINVKRWNYRRSEEYGSGHFMLDGSPGQEQMSALKAVLSKDKKSVLLLLSDMKEVMQMQVGYTATFKGGKKREGDFYLTVHNVDSMDIEGEGFGDIDLENVHVDGEGTEERPDDVASREKGGALFKQLGCQGCHSVDGTVAGMYGPSLQSLYGSKREFTDGTETIADAAYIKESILDPSAKIVEGYNAEMPSYVGVVSNSDIESIILYLKALNKQ